MKESEEQLARKYLNGQCSAEEAQRVLHWFATAAGEKFLSEQINQDAWRLDQPPRFFLPREINSEKMLQRIQQAKEGLAGETAGGRATERWQPGPEEALAPKRPAAWYRIAAVFAGLLLFLAAGYKLFLENKQVTYRTAYGEVLHLTLPDYSKVTLNANSQLTYGTDWKAGEAREVWLEGEAYFSVVHTQTDQLFRVNGAELFKVEVLGTEFNVSTRQSNPRVVLESGKVRLQVGDQKTDTVTMRPGEAVELVGPGKGNFHKKQVNPEVYSSWKSDKLVFEDTSLGDVVLLLKETYGLTVDVRDPTLLDQRFTGSVPNQNVDLLLEGIAQLFDLRVTRNKDRVQFESNS